MFAQHAFLVCGARFGARFVIAFGAEGYEWAVVTVKQQAVIGRVTDVAS